MKGFSYVVDSLAKPELQTTVLPFWHWLLDNLSLIYSLAGFVSGSLRNSSRVIALSVVIDTVFMS
jgi:hypothetical protein